MESKINSCVTLLAEYNENQDNNDHSENYSLLAKYFGTADEIDKTQKLADEHERLGYRTPDADHWLVTNINPYYYKLVQRAASS